MWCCASCDSIAVQTFQLLTVARYQILIKHDRITHMSSNEYLARIRQAPFVVRASLTALIRDTEEKFRCHTAWKEALS